MKFTVMKNITESEAQTKVDLKFGGGGCCQHDACTYLLLQKIKQELSISFFLLVSFDSHEI